MLVIFIIRLSPKNLPHYEDSHLTCQKEMPRSTGAVVQELHKVDFDPESQTKHY